MVKATILRDRPAKAIVPSTCSVNGRPAHDGQQGTKQPSEILRRLAPAQIGSARGTRDLSVSYTHLTLPTNSLV